MRRPAKPDAKPAKPLPPKLGSTLARLAADGLILGFAKRRIAALRGLDIHTVADLLRHYPMRYEKLAAEGGIDELPTDGKTVGSARGEIMAVRWVTPLGSPVFTNKGRFEATLRGEGGVGRRTLRLTWFNAGYLRERIAEGMVLRVQGKAKLFQDFPQMVNPKWEVINEEDQPDAAQERLRPVYPASADMASTQIERLVEQVLPWALPLVMDPVPESMRQAAAMPTQCEALRMIHRPTEMEETQTARRRLAFNELLTLQLAIALRKAEVEQRCVAPKLRWTDAIDKHIRQRFPFELTPTQENAVREIAADLQRDRPMNRMLQGDVGAGKTIVALYAMLMAVADRKQGAIMAPTELLAEQHYLSIRRVLESTDVRVGLLTGRQRGDLAEIVSGGIDLIVGTHALLSEKVVFKDLAVVVIDEQHRFGVMQRAALRQPPAPGSETEAAGASPSARDRMPHTLVMTATPIPRSLSLTLLGDLDNTTLTGLPPGRTPIDNRVVGPEKADEVYAYLRKRLERGEQAYVVLPAIAPRPRKPKAGEADDSQNKDKYEDEYATSAATLKNVTEHAELLREKYFRGYTVGVVHGRLKSEARQQVMDDFRAGKIDVLVATTVIEVGVDVPNATLMVVEHAERFGLAQLHQLRGRIGRGTHGRRSLCVFIAEPTTDDATARMAAIGKTTDGFQIAELDLRIRGMGEILGTRQSGLPPMKLARIPEDMDLLQLAKRDAAKIVADDPRLANERHALLRRVLQRQFGEVLGVVDVG